MHLFDTAYSLPSTSARRIFWPLISTTARLSDLDRSCLVESTFVQLAACVGMTLVGDEGVELIER